MGFPVLLEQAPHMIIGYTTVASPIVLKNNVYSHSTKAYCCFYTVLQKSHGTTSNSTRNTIQQWLPKCAPRIRRDQRPVPRDSVDTFL